MEEVFDQPDKDPRQHADSNPNPDRQNENKNQQKDNQQESRDQLTQNDIPDSTNESTGKMGSGQRQDSN